MSEVAEQLTTVIQQYTTDLLTVYFGIGITVIISIAISELIFNILGKVFRKLFNR